MMECERVSLGGTLYWVLEGDTCAVPMMKEQNRFIICEEMVLCDEYKNLPRGTRVVDVGACYGYYSRMFLRDGFSVTAFEPYPDTFNCLLRNCPEADCRNLAVGDGSRVALDESYMAHGNPGTRQCLPSNHRGKPSCRLDDMKIEGDISLIKIDCEGAEASTLRGASEIIQKHKPTLYIEVFPTLLDRMGSSEDAILHQLRRHAYTWKTSPTKREDDRWDLWALPGKTHPTKGK